MVMVRHGFKHLPIIAGIPILADIIPFHGDQCPITQGSLRVNHAIGVNLEFVAQPLAIRAGAVRGVEGEEIGVGILGRQTADAALELVGETVGAAGFGPDEDAAFALLQAAKIFGDASYKDKAMAMIKDVYSKDIASNLPTGGSNYTGSDPTNPSYFAPAFYAAFKEAGDSNPWDSVISAVYSAIGKLSSLNSNGLFAAWCSGSCSAARTAWLPANLKSLAFKNSTNSVMFLLAPSLARNSATCSGLASMPIS